MNPATTATKTTKTTKTKTTRRSTTAGAAVGIVFFAMIVATIIAAATTTGVDAFATPTTASSSSSAAAAAFGGPSSRIMMMTPEAASILVDTASASSAAAAAAAVMTQQQHHPLLLQHLLLLADADTAAAATTTTVTVDADMARAEFYFYFFAGSGAGGIGASQIPKFLTYVMETRALEGSEPTMGGPSLSPSFFSLVYPGLSERDVQSVLKALPSKGESIVEKGTSKGFLASKGYIVPEDFEASLMKKKNNNNNPLAIRAVYDALTRGTGEALSPIRYEEALEGYNRDGNDDNEAFVSDLNAAVSTKLGAFATLIFLLSGLALIIIDDGIKAFL